jgi:GPH family glycoside/pentoside/hexuronide:cation symporter
VISIRQQMAYGTAELGTSAAELMVRLSLLIFYTEKVGLRPDLAGYAIALGVFWDAVTDPLMGWISDHTRGRWGKRKPYMVVGALTLAFALWALFSPPALEGQWAKAGFLLGSYLVFNTAMTLIAVPHAALGGDITMGSSSRASVFAWRLLFGNLGVMLAALLPAFWADDASVAAGVAAAILGSALVTVVATRTGNADTRTGTRSWADLFRGLLIPWRDPTFRPLFAGYFVATCGLAINSSLALFYYRYFLRFDETQTRAVLGLFLVVFSLSLPLWVMIARRFGAKWPAVVGVAYVGAQSVLVYPIFPAGVLSGPLIAAFAGGLFVGAVVLLDVALADLADARDGGEDSARFGVYFGFWKMGSKIARAIALGLTGNLLLWIGFDASVPVTQEVATRLAWLFGPGVGLFLLAGAGIVAWGWREKPQGGSVLSS